MKAVQRGIETILLTPCFSNMDEKIDALKKLEDEVINLVSSPLYSYRVENNYVPVMGAGSPDADIVFVGEAPGEKEAKSGEPFCGRAGKILDELLASVNIERQDIYITSIVKDRPPKNRDPRPEEIEIYTPYLDRQIEIIKPKVIATLGRFAMVYIMDRYGLSDEVESIGDLHGKVFTTEMSWGDKVKIVPLYHPAAAIYNQSLKATLVEDFKVLKTLV
jgi:uracil-DNA glycosylase